ncbi:MAG: FAD-dependent monooxygenase [Proteobacteria bacterium]|nr:FAD-dependent monooxygenase [Pseudomonadota bacterium]
MRARGARPDVAIVGAGPVGATLALALARSGSDLDVVAIDPRAAGEAGRADRSLALSHGARLIFERLGVWARVAGVDGAVTPIVAIDVSQAGGFGAARLAARELGLPALGYVVSYRALSSALDDALAATNVVLRFGSEVTRVDGTADHASLELSGQSSGSIEARLAVIADGAGAAVNAIARRRRDYGQVALIAPLALAAPHGGIAYERFTTEGPVALLPEGDHYALVWTQSPSDAERSKAMPDAQFLDALARHFGARVERFRGVGVRRSFPLALDVASATTARRIVVIGNAAQSLHPVAGQGFNLGLRDAWELARTIGRTPRSELGGEAMLAAHHRSRRVDRNAGILFTDGLVRLFGNRTALASAARGTGLALLDLVGPARRMFTRAMLYGLH